MFYCIRLYTNKEVVAIRLIVWMAYDLSACKTDDHMRITATAGEGSYGG